MPLIVKTPFVSGTVFTPEVATEMTNVVFDDQPQYYGHFAKVADADLSDAPGAIKTRVANNDLNLKVTAGAGLNALYASGRAIYGTTTFDIGSSSVALTASSANFVYVGVDGVVRATTSALPIVRALLATVSTNTTGVVGIIDQREGYKLEVVKPLASTVKNFGGRGDSGSYVAVNGDILGDGEYYYTNFTVPSGVTITVSKLAKVFITGNAVIAGTVNVTPASLGGSEYLVTSLSGASTGQPGQGFGSRAGETPAGAYSYTISPVGSGGCSGGYAIITNSGLISLTTRVGGNGGGCFWLEAAGNITVTGTINAQGTAGDIAFATGNTASTGWVLGAGSGGSGGLILLKALGTITVSGFLNVSGGNGGTGIVNSGGLGAEGGGGGGGGRIYLAAPAVNTTGSTLNIAGGLGGTNNPSGATLVALNSNGGSYAGLGGAGASAIGLPGGVGNVTTRLVAPLG